MLSMSAYLLHVSLRASLRDDDALLPAAVVHVPNTPAKGVALLFSESPADARTAAYVASLVERAWAVWVIAPPSFDVGVFDGVSERLGARLGLAGRAPLLVALGARATFEALRLRAAGAQLHALLSVDICPALASSTAGGGGAPWYVLQHRRPGCDAPALEAALDAEPNAHLTWLAGNSAADQDSVPEFGALVEWLDPSIIGQGRASARLRGIPLVELPVANARRAVIFLSGDGGWAALDRGVAAALNAAGIAVLGWDSLGYFWQPRSPATLARDLERVIEEFRTRWHLSRVVVAGYSYGASSVPFAVNGLSGAARALIEKVVLLGPTPTTSFEFRLSQWLGSDAHDSARVAPEIARLAPLAVWCVHASDDREAACPALAPPSRVVTLPGDHHFNDDYPALAKLIAAPPLAH